MTSGSSGHKMCGVMICKMRGLSNKDRSGGPTSKVGLASTKGVS